MKIIRGLARVWFKGSDLGSDVGADTTYRRFESSSPRIIFVKFKTRDSLRQ